MGSESLGGELNVVLLFHGWPVVEFIKIESHFLPNAPTPPARLGSLSSRAVGKGASEAFT